MKSNTVRMKVNPKFKDLCFKIKDEKIVRGIEESKNVMSLVKITGMITNMINANPNIFDKLVEVKANGKN